MCSPMSPSRQTSRPADLLGHRVKCDECYKTLRPSALRRTSRAAQGRENRAGPERVSAAQLGFAASENVQNTVDLVIRSGSTSR
jgi:hypothetical protein